MNRSCLKMTASGILLAVLTGLTPYSHPERNSPTTTLELSPFTLQLPTGVPGKPDRITGTRLKHYRSPYFQPEKGKVILYAPLNGVTTASSKFARSELSQTAKWNLSSGVHTLSATVSVDQAPPNGVAIGQLHEVALTGSQPRPPVMLIWRDGAVMVSVLQADTLNAPRKKTVMATHIPLGQQFDYCVQVFPGGMLQISVAGKKKTVQLNPDFAKRDLYFKAGAYPQNSSKAGNGGATISIYRLNVN